MVDCPVKEPVHQQDNPKPVPLGGSQWRRYRNDGLAGQDHDLRICLQEYAVQMQVQEACWLLKLLMQYSFIEVKL
jgi:hypothetical protein